jgi:hypothetical protein
MLALMLCEAAWCCVTLRERFVMLSDDAAEMWDAVRGRDRVTHRLEELHALL